MKRILAVVLAVAVSLCLADQKTSKTDSLFSEIDGISRDLEEITGLKFKKPVPSAVIDKDSLRKFLSHRIDKVMKPSDVRAEALILKMLGLVPQDYDLRQETVDLLTEQAAAFYDYQKKKLFIVAGDTDESSLMALAHELSHALADQHFHLQKYIQQNGESDDAATARMAVMEGQATWLMAAYLHKRAGLGADVPKPILEMMSSTVEQGAEQYPVYSQSPLYVRESLVFPYKGGMLFQDAVYRKLGKEGFAEVFRRAPVSTQQVFHPERYLDRVGPTLPSAPKVSDEKKFRKLAEGTLGEFDYKVLLTQYGSKELAASLSPSLAGSQFVLWEHKHDSYPVLAFASKWESPEKAREFLAAYRNVLKQKSKTFEPGREDEAMLEGRTEAGNYRVVLKGDSVESIEGLKGSVN